MFRFKSLAAVFVCLALALSGCTPKAKPASHAAELFIAVDSSKSTVFISSPAYADRAVKVAGDQVMRLRLGDRVRVVNFGQRTADNAVPIFALQSSYSHRLPDVRQRVEQSLSDLMARNRASGGEDATDLLYALEQADINCSPGGMVLILSDGLVETEDYSASKALSTGGPIHLPAPTAKYLTGGCAVKVLGVGMAAGNGNDAQTLSNGQVRRLEAGLAEYFQAAGVRPDAISFASVL